MVSLYRNANRISARPLAYRAYTAVCVVTDTRHRTRFKVLHGTMYPKFVKNIIFLFFTFSESTFNSENMI